MDMRMTVVALAALLCVASVQAAEVAGVKLEDRIAQQGGSELVLNGAGIRTRLMFKVYVGALYVAAKSPDANAIVAAPGGKRVALHMLRDISSADLAKALDDGLKANNSEAELAPLAARVKEFTAFLTADKDVKTGSVIFLDYLPGTGTRIVFNGQAKGTIAGEDFNRALLKVWLGDKPVDDSLKKAMLGG